VTKARLDPDVREHLIAQLLEDRNRLLKQANARQLRLLPESIDRALLSLGYWSAP
jgi:hypothetical protein